MGFLPIPIFVLITEIIVDTNDDYVGDRLINRSTAITRTSVPFMDERLGWEFPVLDHGFIQIIDYMGDDHAIDSAARMSYGEGTKRKNEARGLINYLMSHHHTSPFEMCEIKLKVKLPVFAARQWIRHRTANVNEYSARYSILDNEFYIPEIQEITAQSTTNKQGRGEMLEGVLASEIRSKMQAHSQLSYNLYEWLLSDDVDLTRELARINLPPNIYTQWVWKTDLHNLFHFLMLRADPHAQKEIRDYAELLEWIVMGWVPMAWDAYRVYRKGAISFSAHEALMIRAALAMSVLDPDNKPNWASVLSMREWKAFIQKIEQIK